MTNPIDNFYNIIIDAIEADEELNNSDVIYVLNRIEHELMMEIDKVIKKKNEDED